MERTAHLARHLASAAAPKQVADLRTPCCLVDLDVARSNAARMLQRAAALGCRLRPHVKTHKTIEGALLQTGGARRGITVSTLAEAAFFAEAGFEDILYAVPITPDKLPEAAALTVALRGTLHVTVDHAAQFDAIERFGAPTMTSARKKTATAARTEWSIVVMVDCGYHRDGVDPASDDALTLCRRIAECTHATLSGLYTHGGHSYDSGNVAAVRAVGAAERDAVLLLARRLEEADVQVPGVARDAASYFDKAAVGLAVGSTPTCSNPPEHLRGVAEMHPGNYIFNDAMQVSLASCSSDADVAVRIATRVVGHYPRTNMLLIDLGWTGCSAQGAESGYGWFEGHPELRIATLKQEAGEVEASDGKPIEFKNFPIGTVLKLVPFHSCASSAAHSKLHVLDKHGHVVDEWRTIRSSRHDGW
eukprot:g2510.t1